jgi:hypothetical protein
MSLCRRNEQIEKLLMQRELSEIAFELNDERRNVNTTWSTRWSANEIVNAGSAVVENLPVNCPMVEAERTGNDDRASTMIMVRVRVTGMPTSGSGKLRGSTETKSQRCVRPTRFFLSPAKETEFTDAKDELSLKNRG